MTTTKVFVVPDSSSLVSSAGKLVVKSGDIYEQRANGTWVSRIQCQGLELMEDGNYLLFVSINLGSISQEFQQEMINDKGQTVVTNRSAYGTIVLEATPQLDSFYQASTDWSVDKVVTIRNGSEELLGLQVRKFKLIGNRETPASERQTFASLTRSSCVCFTVEEVELEEAIQGYSSSFRIIEVQQSAMNFQLPGAAGSSNASGALVKKVSAKSIEDMLTAEQTDDVKLEAAPAAPAATRRLVRK